MKIIFLDVDGVINTINKKKELETLNHFVDWDFNNIFCKMSLKNLQRIVDKTQSQIVLISARRFTPALLVPLRMQFIEYGLWNSLIDKTPIVDPKLQHGQGKELEIFQWLEVTKEHIESFIILDDFAPFFNQLKPALIAIDPHMGINHHKLKECIYKLTQNDPCARCGKEIKYFNDIINCDCHHHWCSNECADADGYRLTCIDITCKYCEDEV
jgi:hypothetical protein